MNKANINIGSQGGGLSTILLVVFIVLKLCGVIQWSWWWVLSPFWIPLCLAVIVAAVCFTMYFISKKL